MCDKYQVDEEKSTAYRRIGRWVHDQAIAEIRTGQKQAALTALTDAQKYLQEGLAVAKKTNNAFEEFQNLTELALLADDAVEATDGSSDIAQQDYLIYLNDLEQALQSPQAQTVPIHDLDVFKNLLQVEKGAYAFVQGRFDEALENYLQGYKGLASIPGYGSVRFRAMWGHLTGRIEKLTDDEMAKAWCEKFIKEWENSFIERGGTRLTLLQLYPEFVRWCELHPLLRSM